MTKNEMIEVMDIYVAPIYNLIGAALAVLVIGFAFYIVVLPFIRRL